MQAVITAVRTGDLAKLREILRSDPSAANPKWIPAVSFNAIGATEALFDGGAAVDGVDGEGMPMAYPIQFGYGAVAEFLAARGARIDLRFAAGLGRLDAVKNWFNLDGSLKAGAGALADLYGFERTLRGQSPFRCERTRQNIVSQRFISRASTASLKLPISCCPKGPKSMPSFRD